MINIIGLGPGNTGYITKLGEKLIYSSDVVIGGKRNLESIEDFEGEKIVLSTNLKEILQYIQNNLDKNISVIASGDPSIYGIGRYLSKNIEHKHLNIVSGISSLQYIFSRIFVDMNDVYITSSHGKVPDFDYILSHKKVCMVTDSKIGPHEISREIQKRNLNKTIVAGENLSYKDERNRDFITGKVPITKEEVRAISINKLDLLNAKTFIDVGAGTGSISIEAGYHYPDLRVIAIERNDDALDLVNKNIENFNLTNVEVVKAYAPVELDIYNEVDAIFLGGTGNKLEEIIDWSKDLLVPGGRLVANFIIIDTFYEMLRLVREKGFKNVDVTVLNVSKLEKLGPGEYFKPHNPIYIISCEKGVE